MAADLFKKKWFFIILFKKGMDTYSSIWERMATNLFFYLGGGGHLSTILCEGTATNLFFYLGRDGHYLLCYLERMATNLFLPFGRGWAFIYPSIWKGMATNLPNHLDEDCHLPFYLDRDGCCSVKKRKATQVQGADARCRVQGARCKVPCSLHVSPR